jgi:hypothetical protein
MEKDNWYIVGNKWMRCEIVGKTFGGIVTVKLYNDPLGTDLRQGRARKGLYGLLVEEKN